MKTLETKRLFNKLTSQQEVFIETRKRKSKKQKAPESEAEHTEMITTEIDPTLLFENFPPNVNENIARTIMFDQEINEASATELKTQLLALCAEDSGRPIRLMLGTPGGGLYESLAIYDTIKMLPVKTIAICNGKVMSGGILVLLACDEKVSTPSTTFMMHHGHTTLSGNVPELKEQIREIEVLNNRMLDAIIKTTRIRRDQLDEWLIRDHYLNAEQAQQYGLINKIITNLNEI